MSLVPYTLWEDKMILLGWPPHLSLFWGGEEWLLSVFGFGLVGRGWRMRPELLNPDVDRGQVYIP